MLELTIRLIFSLAVVLGLLALLTRFGGRRFAGKNDAMIRVVHRQAISRGSTVSVVSVAGRVLVLGSTDQQVRVLAELDPEEIAPANDAEVLSLVAADESTGPATATSGAHRATNPEPGGRRKAPAGGGALNGSVLSADTWRRALAAATRRAS